MKVHIVCLDFVNKILSIRECEESLIFSYTCKLLTILILHRNQPLACCLLSRAVPPQIFLLGGFEIIHYARSTRPID